MKQERPFRSLEARLRDPFGIPLLVLSLVALSLLVGTLSAGVSALWACLGMGAGLCFGKHLQRSHKLVKLAVTIVIACLLAGIFAAHVNVGCLAPLKAAESVLETLLYSLCLGVATQRLAQWTRSKLKRDPLTDVGQG